MPEKRRLLFQAKTT